MSLKDKYIIDRDGRSCGGTLTRVATYDTWKEATAAWAKTTSDRPGIVMWLARLEGGREGHCTTLACKGGNDASTHQFTSKHPEDSGL